MRKPSKHLNEETVQTPDEETVQTADEETIQTADEETAQTPLDTTKKGIPAMLYFASDYQEGAHPAIMRRLAETNLSKTSGYGTDEICESARERIREACECPEAEVHFLAGGTQTNAIVISALLHPWQGVVAADTGHISIHEAGAIEAGGHKVMTLPHTLGKISAQQVSDYCKIWENDPNHDHMVSPGMVYLSQPTEYGTLYSLEELQEMRRVCDRHGLRLYIDGARLAYALAAVQTAELCSEPKRQPSQPASAGPVSQPAQPTKACFASQSPQQRPQPSAPALPDLARLCDVFYIGGTKCGALLGEAVVIPDPATLPHFFTIIKQRGALLAKGRILGIQFDELFRDGLYLEIGKGAVEKAGRIQNAFRKAGYETAFESPTNQIFLNLEDKDMQSLGGRIAFSFWEKSDDTHTIVRLATSWATTEEEVETLEELLGHMEPVELSRKRT